MDDNFEDRPSLDYRISLTCGYMGMDLDFDALNDIKQMKTDELENIVKQLNYWSYIFNDILTTKKG